MKIELSYVLMLAGLLLSIAMIFNTWIQGKKLTQNKIMNHLLDAAQFIGGIYAILYALIILIYNAFKIPAQIPQDQSTLLFVLILGGISMIYKSNIKKHFPKKKTDNI